MNVRVIDSFHSSHHAAARFEIIFIKWNKFSAAVIDCSHLDGQMLFLTQNRARVGLVNASFSPVEEGT